MADRHVARIDQALRVSERNRERAKFGKAMIEAELRQNAQSRLHSYQSDLRLFHRAQSVLRWCALFQQSETFRTIREARLLKKPLILAFVPVGPNRRIVVTLNSENALPVSRVLFSPRHGGPGFKGVPNTLSAPEILIDELGTEGIDVLSRSLRVNRVVDEILRQSKWCVGNEVDVEVADPIIAGRIHLYRIGVDGKNRRLNTCYTNQANLNLKGNSDQE